MRQNLESEYAFPKCKKTGRAFQAERTAGTKAKRQKSTCNNRCGTVLAQHKNLKMMAENTFGLNDKLTVT